MMGLLVYWLIFALMMLGLYIVIAYGNLIKKVIGLSVLQVSIFILYIVIANVEGGSVPILVSGVAIYSNPLPHVLILTAIVVGIATVALALSLIIRIRQAFGTIEEDAIQDTAGPEQ